MASKPGTKIQKLRKARGISQEELAEMVKISRTHMGHIEQGRRSPSLSLLNKISKALKVSAGEIIS